MPNRHPYHPPTPAAKPPRGISFHKPSGRWRDRSVKPERYAATVEELVALREAPKPVEGIGPETLMRDYFTYWLGRLDLRRNTVDQYRYNVETYLDRLFGDIALGKMTDDDIRAKLRGLTGRGGRELAPRTKLIALSVVRKALQQATDDRIIGRNPAIKLKLLPRGKGGRQKMPGIELPIPDADTARRLMETAEGHRWYPLLALSLLTGLRQSEALALQWGDVAMAKKLVHVKRSMLRRLDEVEDPKNDTSWRSVWFDEGLTPILRRHWTRQAEERLAIGLGQPQPSDLVFTNEQGEPADVDAIYRWFTRLCRKAGTIHYRWHDLRHAYATGLWAEGVSIEEISKLL